MRHHFLDSLIAQVLYEWRTRHLFNNPFADRCWR